MEAKFCYSLKGPEQTQPYARNSPAVWIPSTTIRCDSPVRYLMDFPSPSEIINRFANKFVSIFVMRSDKQTATTIAKKKKYKKTTQNYLAARTEKLRPQTHNSSGLDCGSPSAHNLTAAWQNGVGPFVQSGCKVQVTKKLKHPKHPRTSCCLLPHLVVTCHWFT